MKFDGVFSVLPTPFTSAGEVDRESLRRVVDLYIDAGVDGLVTLGVMSEAALLLEQERAVVLETVLEQTGGRVPVVVGTTAPGSHLCLAYSRQAREAGAAGLLVSPPRLAKLNSGAVLAHFQELAAGVDLPIVVQDYPPVCGYTLEAALLVGIAREVSSARTIKLEDPPTPFKTTRIRKEAQELEVSILGGLGGVFLLEELMAGATGAMTGFAYPEILVRVVRAFRAGAVEEASEVFYRFVPMMRFEFQAGIGVALRKEILHRRGVIAHPGVRSPGTPLDDSTRQALDRMLAWMNRQEGALWTSV